jgi:hypothetical protein
VLALQQQLGFNVTAAVTRWYEKKSGIAYGKVRCVALELHS